MRRKKRGQSPLSDQGGIDVKGIIGTENGDCPRFLLSTHFCYRLLTTRKSAGRFTSIRSALRTSAYPATQSACAGDVFKLAGVGILPKRSAFWPRVRAHLCTFLRVFVTQKCEFASNRATASWFHLDNFYICLDQNMLVPWSNRSSHTSKTLQMEPKTVIFDTKTVLYP